jgi:hypothetical protein
MASNPRNSSRWAQPSPPPPTRAHDQLTALPNEILQQISYYLYPSHVPDREIHFIHARYAGTRYKPKTRDLSNLSRASKRLYQQTNAWAHLFLHTNSALTKYRVFKTPKAAADQLPALQKLLQWSCRNCVFCGKASQREAVFMNGLHCCERCDNEQWSEKITETEARRMFEEAKVRYPRKGVKLPGLRSGTCFFLGGCTTMYSRKDVEAFMQRERTAIVIEDDEDDDHDDGTGDAVEVVRAGVKSGAVLRRPIVIDDD